MSVGNKQPIDTSERVPGSERLYDLVAIDVDGTLVTSEKKLSPRIATLIRETQARGIGVTLVSGRPKLKMTPLLEELGLELPYIGSGGAYIVDPRKNLVILHCPLAYDEAEAIVELARAAKAAIISQEPEHLYYEGRLEDLEELIAISKIDITGVEGSQIEILRVDDILRACAEPTKINICSKPDHLLKIEKELRPLNLPIYLTYSSPISLEITRSGINKGEALKILAAYLAIPLERILVIGDSHNDISMFKVAGMAVAMGNAPREVKATTDLVAPSNDEDGVAWVLREMVLKGHDPSCLRILNADRTVHQYRSLEGDQDGSQPIL